MSWSVYTQGLAADINGRVAALEPPGDGTTEREEQVKVAKDSAKAVIESGAVGSPEAFSVTLSGHSSNGHTSGDSLAVSVAQSTATAVQAFDAQQAAATAAEQ